ncbi:putative DNA-directed RNA polymerase I and III subunit Rpc40 [Pseudovirgaria hyperparasitica]|uniref:DNA-directed RNA polymerases I and III subunit RPAC1 n=1 Tax=Pseudovirgaria hyperparasitica TaxID=470096 RepID=A0A6A6VTZ2_9PEZI|nr:putative DNA-directed RNA polymerase I and III subunit Rpc40 [Pseudovirgaria hyperparasitica]KAF2753204.1 putative DNA-directed RNA polymerase I and III subunit Rpc40 [Pseudovirgaria hyperparasitica]
MSPAVVPSEEAIQKRRIIGIGTETVSNITSTDFPGHWPGEDNSWDVDKFRDKFRVQFHMNEPHNAQFSLIGLDAAVANAFRRILIAEIPVLAIESVFFNNNTSIIQDEVLAHRLGLVPLTGGKEGLNWLRWRKRDENNIPEEPNDFNTIVLVLEAECKWSKDGPALSAQGETDPDKLYVGHNVLANQIVFHPMGQHNRWFGTPETTIRPVNPDILIAKLRPGQKIVLSMHAEKGIGADHAKYSPVCPASYRLLPHIDIQRPIIGKDHAKKFARCFPKGVIGFEAVTHEEASMPDAVWRRTVRDVEPDEKNPYAGHEGEPKAVVVNAMKDTVSRECLRHEEFKDKVKLGRVRDHFIFQVESTGQWDSDELFLESVKLLKAKCLRVKRDLDLLTQS